MRFCALFIILMSISSVAYTKSPQVTVVGLGSNKAVMSINGNQYTLSIGQRSPEGVKLMSITTHDAVIEINDRQTRLPLGVTVGNDATEQTVATVDEESNDDAASDDEESIATVVLTRDRQGMYRVNGTINGKTVSFLVDTGASQVAMNTAEAKRLGINYEKNGKRIHIRTAGGTVTGYQVTITRLTIGEAKLYNVKGMIVSGSSPKEILLGMSVLERFEMQNKGQVLLLKQKW